MTSATITPGTYNPTLTLNDVLIWTAPITYTGNDCVTINIDQTTVSSGDVWTFDMPDYDSISGIDGGILEIKYIKVTAIV